MMEEKGKNRKLEPGGYIPWVDTAKGIGVILTIIGHLWYYSNIPTITTIIYSFHVSMFFILSGYVFSRNEHESYGVFLKKKAERLLLPAFLIMLIFSPLNVFLRIRNGEFYLLDVLLNMFFFKGRVILGLAYWFFVVIFEIMAIEGLLSITTKDLRLKWSVAILNFLLGYILYKSQLFFDFFGVHKAIIAYGFFVFGNILHDMNLKYNSCKEHFKNIIILSCFIAWMIAGVFCNKSVSMYALSLGRFWFFIISGITGSIVYFKICGIIDKYISVFRKFAPNTVFIIGTHVIVTAAFGKIMTKLQLDHTYIYSITAFIFAIVLAFMYLPVCKIVNKKFPILNGRVSKSK